MKIGIITDSIDCQPTGIGVYVENLVENLLKIDKKNEYILIHHGSSLHPLYRKAKELKYPFIPKIPKMIQDSFFLSYTKEKFDIVHKPNPTGFLFPIRFKTVVTAHDLSPIICKFLTNPLYRLLYSYEVKTTFRKASAIIANSRSTEKDIIYLCHIPERKISVIYPGISKPFSVDLKQEKEIRARYNLPDKYILFVGTIEPRKNIFNLIKAFLILKKKYKIPHELIIAGKLGWGYRSIIREIDRVRTKHGIRLFGFVTDIERDVLYRNASCFVYPSFYEGFGFPPLEAMACGCPVVTSNTSSIPEVVGKAGIMVDPYNIEVLAKVVGKVLVNNRLREEMIKNGIVQAKKFTWEKCARKTLDVYNKS